MKKEKPFEEKFRSRWHRWLSQKCRADRYVWTELLGANWTWWLELVYTDTGIAYKPLTPFADRITVLMVYKRAIQVCNFDHMQKLDAHWCEDNWEKKYK